MSGYPCPLNKRSCRCDPQAANEKFRPCALARRIGVMVRMLGEEREEVATAATYGLRRLLPGEGIAFSDLAILVENANGEVEALKYSDQDAEAIFARGVEEGRKQNTGLSTSFVDNDGAPRWLEMAKFCDESPSKITLEPRERDFVEEMVFKMRRYGAPRSDKQGGYLLSLFFRLRGSLK